MYYKDLGCNLTERTGRMTGLCHYLLALLIPSCLLQKAEPSDLHINSVTHTLHLMCYAKTQSKPSA